MIDLKPYVVILTVKPSARLPQNMGRLELNFPNTPGPRKVWITKIEEESSGTLVQTGVRFRVFVDSENITEAINSAKTFADGIASMITLLVGKGMDIPREEIAYELTPDVQKREFRQIFYEVPIKSASRRQVDPQKLSDFIDRTLKTRPPDSEHISRAIRWYRLGATVTDFFDQFNSFWIGLEALNPLLQRKFSIEDDIVRCPRCKHKWIATPTVSGIRFFIQNEMKGEKHLYRDVHQLRIDIMHSTKRLSELLGPARTLAPKTGEILFRAICFVLEFEDWNLIEHSSILREFPMRGELHALLLGNDPTSLGIDGQDPCFELSHNLKKTETCENGRTSFKVESSFTARINRGVQFENVELRLYGDNETSGEISESVPKRTDAAETKPDHDIRLDFEVVDVVSGQEDWSIYKLMDGTILKIRMVLIKALRQNSFDSKGNPNYQLNTETIIGTVPSKNDWGKPSPPFTLADLQFSIANRELKFETLHEPWNKYVLSDETKLRTQIALTTASKTAKHYPNGEPVYMVNWTTNVESEVPEALRKKL